MPPWLVLALLITSLAADEPWTAPEEARARRNPVTPSEAAVQKGHALYQRYCLSCHGAAGKGDGPAARFGSRLPGDLSGAEWQARVSDGEVLWKVTRGLKVGAEVVMPRFEEEIPREEDRWKLVLFVRTLGPPPAKGP